MFSFFKKKSPVEKLQKEYEQLMKAAFELSKVDRKLADAKVAEAEKLLDKIKAIQGEG